MDVEFKGIVGHRNVTQGGSKYTVYFLWIAVDGIAYTVEHRYQDFKDLHDKVSCSRT